MPAGYVTALFDQYAPKFDKSLVDDLDYRGPQELLKAVLTARHAEVPSGAFPPGHRSRMRHRASPLRSSLPVVDEFVGVDLSSGMIERARAAGLYCSSSMWPICWRASAQKPMPALTLSVAADAFVYVPDLAPPCDGRRLVLQPQWHAGLHRLKRIRVKGSSLGSLRYAHSADYLRATLEGAGLTVSAITPVSTRMEAGNAVPGLVVTASKP